MGVDKCVCVCVREREREISLYEGLQFSVSCPDFYFEKHFLKLFFSVTHFSRSVVVNYE